MEISKRQAVRIFLIVYTCVGVVFFFLWTFVQTIRQYPFLENLFFVFLPAVLVFPYLIIEAIGERFSTLGDHSKKSDSEDSLDVEDMNEAYKTH